MLASHVKQPEWFAFHVYNCKSVLKPQYAKLYKPWNSWSHLNWWGGPWYKHHQHKMQRAMQCATLGPATTNDCTSRCNFQEKWVYSLYNFNKKYFIILVSKEIKGVKDFLRTKTFLQIRLFLQDKTRVPIHWLLHFAPTKIPPFQHSG